MENAATSPWLVLDASDALQLVLDAGGRIVFANRRLCRWLDTTSDRLYGMPWHEAIVASKARKTAEADFPRLARARNRQEFRYPLINPSGVEVTLTWHWTRIPVRLGVPGSFLLAGFHAEDRAGTVLASSLEMMTLERERSLFNRMFSATTNMLAFLDRDLRFVRVNGAFASFHQCEARQLLGRRFSEINADKRFLALLQEVMRQKQSRRRQLKMTFPSPHSIEIDSEWSMRPILDRRGNVDGVLVSIQDVTERMLMSRQLEQTNLLLKRSLSGTVEAISKAEEARDPYTAGHQQRVSQLSVAIAAEMGMDADRIEGVRLGALTHDIGKIQTPAELLSKPMALNPFEYEIVKQHAATGFEILKDIPFPWPIAQIAYQHHERMDGTGYPRGLSGNEILTEARIVAVADVMEAMGFHRPYRAAVGIEAALAELREHRGRHYDATHVDACLRLFAEGRFSFEA